MKSSWTVPPGGTVADWVLDEVPVPGAWKVTVTLTVPGPTPERV